MVKLQGDEGKRSSLLTPSLTLFVLNRRHTILFVVDGWALRVVVIMEGFDLCVWGFDLVVAQPCGDGSAWWLEERTAEVHSDPRCLVWGCGGYLEQEREGLVVSKKDEEEGEEEDRKNRGVRSRG